MNQATQAQLQQNALPLPLRLWIYQRERFPLLKHGLVIAAFSSCAVCFSALLRDTQGWPSAQSLLTSFLCLLLFFFQLRLADEFKDHAKDCRYQPHRAVPRGLVSLSELRGLFLLTCLIQFALCWLLAPAMLLLLLIVWGYMALMRVEFFASRWLEKRPVHYLWTHMLIMPVIDLFATGCDWSLQGAKPPTGLGWFLLLSFFNGIIIELGRKTWAPEQEKPGVESYSSQWGIRPALALWLSCLSLSILCACFAANNIGFLFPVAASLILLALPLSLLAKSFAKKPSKRKATLLETSSGIWVLSVYLLLGLIPMASKAISQG